MPSNEAFSVTSKIHAVLMEVWAASVKAFGVLAHTLKEMSTTVHYNSSNIMLQSSRKLFIFSGKLAISSDSMGSGH